MMNIRTSVLCTALLMVLLTTGTVPLMDAIAPERGRGHSSSMLPTRGLINPEDAWPMYMGNLNHTGLSASRIPKVNNTLPLWTVDIPSLMTTASPVLYEGVLYIPSGDGSVHGFDMLTGEKVWEVKALNNFIRSSVTIDNGIIYFGARGGHLFGYRISDKAKVLELDLNASDFESSPIIAGGRLYIGSIANDLKGHWFYAIDLSTKGIAWSFQMNPGVENIYGFRETPAYYDGSVYTSDGAGNFFCLDSQGFEDGNDGSYTSEVNASIGDADIIWMFSNPYSIIGDPMLAEGHVFFGTENGLVFCLDATTGTNVWSKVVGKGQRSIQTSPAYRDGTVYITCRNSVGPFEGGSAVALNSLTGSPIWRFNITQPVTESSPVLADSALIFASRDSKIYCLSTTEDNLADEDRPYWYFNTGSPITSTAAVGGGMVYIAREDTAGSMGKVYAFGSPDPSIKTASISDPAPFLGERVVITAELENNATVPAVVSIEFKATNLNNSNQKVLDLFEDIRIEPFGNTLVKCNWTASRGFDYIVTMIKDSSPKDRNPFNNFRTIDVMLLEVLSGYWTSSGSGADRSGGALRGLESNRTYWKFDFGGVWSGPAEPMWYGSFSGNGTITATGPTLYLTGPGGELHAYNTTAGPTGVPGPLWTYDNPSVDMIGRPVALVESFQTMNGPNRVFSLGSDNAIWAFDWAGFWDGKNDGPYLSETGTGALDADIVWRTALSGPLSQPPLITAGNLVIMTRDGILRALDDDTGAVAWTLGPFDEAAPMCAGPASLYLADGTQLFSIDPSTSEIRTITDLATLIGTDPIRSISLQQDRLLLSAQGVLFMLDATPDDNGDGIVDSSDKDEGVKDNVTSRDLIWTVDLLLPLVTPPAVSMGTGRIATATAESMVFIHPNNGTVSGRIALLEPCTGRMVSGGDSFYIVTGSGTRTVRAFSPNDLGNPVPTWTLSLEDAPRGELVLSGGNMYISMGQGEVLSIGASNDRPTAVISSPGLNLLVFPGEPIFLNASLSSDPDDDDLIYSWSAMGSLQPLVEGPSPTATITLDTLGKVTLVLRVYDTMRAYGEAQVNVTVLKRVTYPDFTDYFYGVNVHMSYGIAEVSGWGLVDISVPDDPPSAQGSIFICRLEFQPWPSYAAYRFEWANVTIGFSDKEFPVRMETSKVRLYRLVDGASKWVMAADSGVNASSQKVHGNFSDLRTGLYAIGILDNSIPQLKHAETKEYRSKLDDPEGWMVRVEYRDLDNEAPVFIKLVMDNSTTYDLTSGEVSPVVNRFTFFKAQGIKLAPGRHLYYFEASDGNFTNSTKVFVLNVQNSPPVPSINGPSATVLTGEPVIFDASLSSDPDGDTLTYSWDFNDRDGVQKEAVDKKVDHIYYEEGIYIVTLTVSDGTDSRSTTLTISVVKPIKSDGESRIPDFVLYMLIALLIVLVIAALVFGVLYRKKGKEDRTVEDGFGKDWSCPECSNVVPGGARDCSECGYEYDPMDFEE
jgi:outer membrane protein assembly factor BamB